ncbi:MAG: DUF5719 family protein [Actinomycetota bacterium]|nr:DUF5719 family protein [Actinomycetota bacterium]
MALLAGAAIVASGIGLQRLGPRSQPAAEAGRAPSGTWVCPHGGGTDWRTTVYLANPGTAPSIVRVTSLSGGAPKTLPLVTVAGGSEGSVDVPSGTSGSVTMVEWFGGWVAAGWVSVTGGSDGGVAAEPCGRAATTWFAPDGSTVQGQDSTYLVIANPSAADAVFDVALFAPDRPPIRDTRWTNLVLHGYRSMALRVSLLARNESTVSAELDVSSGRVAMSSSVISRGGGVRSAMGQASLSTRALLPVAGGAGQTEVVLAAPGQADLAFGATLLSGRAPQPAGGLVGTSQTGQSAKAYPVIVDGPSSVDVLTQGALVAAAIRSQGQLDGAATGGALEPEPDWVVLPTVGGEPSHPGLVIVNPGTEPARVTLHLIGAEGATVPADVTVTVRPETAVAVPTAFLQPAPEGAIVVRSDGAGIVALGGSTSLGSGGNVGYAMSLGVPMP